MRTGSPTAMLPEESARHTEPARLRSAVRAPVPMTSSSSLQGAATRTTSRSTSPMRRRSPGVVGTSPWEMVILRRVPRGSTGVPRSWVAASSAIWDLDGDVPVLGAVVAVTDDAKAGFDVHGLDGTHGEPAGGGDVDGRDHRRLFAAGGLVAAHDSAWSRQSDAEFMQYRSPVAVGPSGNTWPRRASQAAQRASVRTMPWLRSSMRVTRPSVISRSKLGQPVPESNLASLSNSSVSHTTQRYTPASLVSQYSPVNARSVPASWVTWYCSGVRRLRISSSDGRRSVGFVMRGSPLGMLPGVVEHVSKQLVRCASDAEMMGASCEVPRVGHA